MIRETGAHEVDMEVLGNGESISPNEERLVSLKQTLKQLSPLPKSRFADVGDCQGESSVGESKKEQKCSSPIHVSALELLSSYGSGLKKSKQNKRVLTSFSNETRQVSHSKLSTEEVMRRAGAWFIELSDLANPYIYAHSLGWPDQDDRDIKLAHILLASAEKLGYQQYESAGRLLSNCEWLATPTGNAVERVVFHFAKALRERINAETGRITYKAWDDGEIEDDLKMDTSSNLTSLGCHQMIPFTQVTQFAGIQAILDTIGVKRTIHLIDFGVRSGVQWTGLLQALHQNKNIRQLKVTAVGTIRKSQMEETGKRLESFAATMRLSFQYRTVLIPSMFHLRREHFKTEPDDIVVVHAPLVLRTMLHMPSCLEHLMRVIKHLNPALMVVAEVEADHNSPSFVKRFIEALFFYSAFFDSLEECMERESEVRMKVERALGEGILNMVSAEGEERVTRNVKLETWRAFFERFGMMECELSEAALFQAETVAGRFGRGGACKVVKDGLSLIVGWKETPIHSLSIWKFSSGGEN